MTSDELEKLASAGDTIAAEVLKQREENQKNFAAMTEQFETPEKYTAVYKSVTNAMVDAVDIVKALNEIRKELHTMNSTLEHVRRSMK
jgi:hypothetical protein